MRIMYLVPDLNIGGVTTIALNNINELEKKGCLVKLITLRSIEDNKKNIKINYESLGFNSSKDVFKALIRFNNIVKEFAPNIMHSHTHYPNIFIRIYSVIYGYKGIKICNEHGTYNKNINTFNRVLLKATKFVPDYFVNVSEKSLESYTDSGIFIKNRSKVLYNGIYLNKFIKNKEKSSFLRRKHSLLNESNLFGYIGRLSKEKDVINLLQAINILKDLSKESFKLIIIGDGLERNNLIDFVNSHNLNDIVIFVGEKSDVVPYLSIIDILVLPSKTEGLPTVLLEAMVMECLIVSTDCSGVQEILSGTKSYIVPVENPYELACKMNEVLELDFETRELYGRGYRDKIISTFSIEHTINKIYALYSSALYKDKL